MKYAMIGLPEDFEKGNCDDCPFLYIDENIDPNDESCIFNYKYKDVGVCKLNIKDFASISDALNSCLGQMRDATEEEHKSIADFIKRLSKPTGINFYDVLDENGNVKYNEFDKMCEQTRINQPERND